MELSYLQDTKKYHKSRKEALWNKKHDIADKIIFTKYKYLNLDKLFTQINQDQLNGKVKIIKYSISALFLLICINTFPQQSFRRHFLIADDISTPFIISKDNCPRYTQALINLFSNKPVENYNEAYQENLDVEKKNGLLFFDKYRDEISFYHFNIASSELGLLRSTKTSNETRIVEEFNKLFLKNKNFNWSTFSTTGNVSSTEYLLKALSIQPTPANFSSGVSMSNFVYPLVLNKIDSTKYAEEYVLILLSDFLTGSMLGNTKDLDRVRDIYQVPYGIRLSPNSAVSYIKKEIDYLASQYYKIDFFQYSFIPTGRNNPIGIIALKIKPKIGVLTPEDVSLFVDGNLRIDQRGYQSQRFKTSETKIKFTHNKNISPIQLEMIISTLKGDAKEIIFNDVIADKDGNGEWHSKYTTDKKLMNFDSAQLSYYLPSLKFTLDPFVNSRNFSSLIINYKFKTKYSVVNKKPLNFIYSTERGIPIENIYYSTKITIIIMYVILPILLLLLLANVIAYYGKPSKMFFNINGYLDSFEIIDYKTVGKLLTPYKVWNYRIQKIDHLIVNGNIEFFSSSIPLLNWNSKIILKLQEVTVPNGFDIFIKQNIKDIKEFSTGTTMIIKNTSNNQIKFVVGIRQYDSNKKITRPELVKFKIEAKIEESRILIKSKLSETIEYKFHIGEDLGDVWVGFDPGTTGSCVAVGSASNNIILGEDIANNKIIPSLLIFELAENYKPNGGVLPETLYKYGAAAEPFYSLTRKYKGFQSIKKLLGFKDVKEVKFDNGKTLPQTGKDLAGLLVKGLFNDINTYFNRPGFNAENYLTAGKFNPLRSVVAIPNNFTISKIQDMVDCIGNLNQFKEIRYIYEAEAVLFYYLSNYSLLNKSKDTFKSETILVFDMGGATINATVVTAKKTLVDKWPKYNIDFLGKIGYGIGGDTIDYCIVKLILNHTEEFPNLINVDLISEKINLANMAKKIKELMVRTYYSTKEENLITSTHLEGLISEGTGISINIIEESSELYKLFKRDKKNWCKIFDHPIFTSMIYDNVNEAVNEVIELSGRVHIDKVIFSGRSTAYPMIRENVEKQLKTHFDNTKSITLNLEDSKTAVAKGACWYGINKNSVRLNNLKTKAAFGFKKTLSANTADLKFYKLVEMGCTFDIKNEGIDSFQGVVSIIDDFAFDGGKVNFYQVMGKDVNKILSSEQKHKFSKISSISLDHVTSEVAMKVNENDEVDCAVILDSNRKIISKGVVSDQEIDEANEEHYTWIVK